MISNSFVSWKDYEGLSGFSGQASQQQVGQLLKALNAGSDINNPGSAPGVGFPLRPESLERTLKVVTYGLDDVRLWRQIEKIPAYNTVEEFNRLESYGQNDYAAFIAEGDLPEEDSSTYSRNYVAIKFMGTQGKVSHVMSLIKPVHQDNIAQETVNRTAHLLKQVEQSMFFGDSSLAPLQWDGIVTTVSSDAPAANIIDMRGKPLNEDALNDGAMTVKAAPNFGRATDLHLSDGAYSDLAKDFYPAERFNMPQGGQGWDGMVGTSINGFRSMFGPIMFNPNTFIQPGLAATAAVGDAAKRPAAVTQSVAPAAAGSGSKFTAADAGDYRYKVVGVNRFGKSAALDLGPVTVAAGQQVTFTVADGAVVADYYLVYRSAKDGAAATALEAFKIARAGATTVITDTNAYLPGTSKAIMVQNNLEFYSFKQLAPFVKIPLATVDTNVRWMQLLYGAPTVYAPGKAVVYINVGRASGSVGSTTA